ncbi:MAG: ATP-dependent DNA helicase RecG [Gammaproteobacteria bacterium]|nr:ATP-dependent DNA helicase RecG [Gammaproteobacteria bacterium]
MRATDPTTRLKGVGPSAASKLEKLGIYTVNDLILHFPSRYQDRTRSVPLREVGAGRECLVTGTIVKTDLAYGRRRSLTATIQDGTGYLTLRLFHFSARQRDTMQAGLWIRCFGEARTGPTGLEMIHPDYRLYSGEPPPPDADLTPVYPATEGLTSPRLRTWIAAALDLVEEFPSSTLEIEPFEALLDAVRFLHCPAAESDSGLIETARRRVAFDELLAHYLVMKSRQATLQRQITLPLPSARQLGRKLLDRLGFRLTNAQRRVLGEVLTDLDSQTPMMRLLQGDVGSGKTVIAAFAAIRAAEHGAQTAIMAPTEILAEQHFETFSEWLTPLGIEVALLSGRMPASERNVRLASIAEGEALVIVGTHALFQSSVTFHQLGLAIVDEQHRFGVHQRMRLRDKGRLPHQLIMTATPIPRTLTMALYADMDVSIIDELPPGRLEVATRVIPVNRRAEVTRHIADACAEGRQTYWVCTLIEASQVSELHAAETTAAELERDLQGLTIGLVHGRMGTAEKTRTMARFKAGEIDLLVATTVIEVGVDVPNASLMVIDNAERLGLAQLHQLRGRIGRGDTPSHCILLFEPPLSAIAKARLNVMRSTHDGFEIAEKDLELRGPGDVLGTLQSGAQAFRIADLGRDAALLPQVAETGARLIKGAPAMAQTVVDTWSSTINDKTGYTAV